MPKDIESIAIALLEKSGYTIKKKDDIGPKDLFLLRKKDNNGKWFYVLRMSKIQNDWWEEFYQIKTNEIKFETLKRSEE